MTDAERKRAVEVMARANALRMEGDGWWECADKRGRDDYRVGERAALTALLRIADVKIKDQADDS